VSRRRPEPHDRLVLVVVGGLLAVAFVALGLLGAIALLGADASDLLLGALITTLGTAVGQVGSVLSQTGSRSSAPTPVEVQQPPDLPVPVSDAGHADTASLVVVTAISVIVVTIYHLLVRYA
jgi:hypothetical protein